MFRLVDGSLTYCPAFKIIDGSLYYNENKIIRFICCAGKSYKNEKVKEFIYDENYTKYNFKFLAINGIIISKIEFKDLDIGCNEIINFTNLNAFNYYIKNRLNLLYGVSDRIGTSRITGEPNQTYTWSGYKKVSGGIYQITDKKYKAKDNMFRLYCTFRGVRHIEEFKCASTKWDDVSQGIVDYFKKNDKQILLEFYKYSFEEYEKQKKKSITDISYNKPV